jgi:hypothetical protein
MAIYYVRKTGNDSNNGLSAGAAWLTITKAANTVSAGDTVYIGAGTYRELVTMITSGTSGNIISFIGDVDGVQTGDNGYIIITAHDSETAAPARTGSMDPNIKKFITWQYCHFIGGSVSTINGPSSGAESYEAFTIQYCYIAVTHDDDIAVRFLYSTGISPAGADGFLLDSCTIFGRVTILITTNVSAHIDLKIRITNNVIITKDDIDAIFIDYSSSNNFSAGGILIANNTMYAGQYSVQVDIPKNDIHPIRVYNNIMINSGRGISTLSTIASTIIEDYNIFCGIPLTLSGSGITSGGNSVHGSIPLLGAWGDFPFRRLMGWSPFVPLAPMRMPSGYVNPAINFSNASFVPTVDIYNNPRPMGRSNISDAGAVEARIRAQPETGVKRSGASSASFSGKGFADFWYPVKANSSFVTVWTRWDSNYTGTKPKIEIFNIPGVTDKIATATGSANNWEQLTIAPFTPTQSGWIRVRISSQDTSATGIAYFDDLLVVT